MYQIDGQTTLYSFGLRRAEQKSKYRGELFPANYPANETAITYLDFFQFDTRTNSRKGIIPHRFTRLLTMMIKNEQQYHYSLACLRQFEDSIAELEKKSYLKSRYPALAAI
ncbi:DUF6932 family protein [[Phormidium] sp. ETS-05]|uniref:DUF6932 family protein n=1 Tax=[Phormidium] sp. ETS-05 TaxID=222819 RepID=UPI001E53FDCB|nr:hypothetical protein [[Phormidium] sp. ETS-05]